MSDLIRVTVISATGFHGVFEEERRSGQVFIVDVELRVDLALPGATDDVTTTVDYGAVAKVVEGEIKGEPVNLIEKLASRISSRIFSEFNLVDSLVVTVHKPSAPVQVLTSDISISIERFR